MNNRTIALITLVIIVGFTSSCIGISIETNNEETIQPGNTAVSNTPTNTSVPLMAETSTPTQYAIPTNTITPGPTPLPGSVIIPLYSMDNRIPWLPLEEGDIPMSVFFGFNVEKPPFNNVLVRQAFAAAIDREQVAEEAAGLKFRNVTPATSFTPRQVLGRDLFNEVGTPFNPVKAKELLQQAGYSNPENFPPVTLVVSTRGQDAPDAYSRLGQTITEMWKTHLGVTVELQVIENWKEYLNRLETNLPEIYEMGWGADINDPDNFLNLWFHSNSDFNYGHFNSSEFDRLVELASILTDPAERQILYIQAEQILTEQDVGVIPLFHTLYYENR